MSPQGLLPRRVYRGAVGAKRRYFARKLPLALGAERATFVFVQAEDATASAVRTWGKQHAGLWAALAATGRAVEVAVVGRDPDRLRKAGRVVDAWTKVSPAADPAAIRVATREQFDEAVGELYRTSRPIEAPSLEALSGWDVDLEDEAGGIEGEL